MPGSGLGDPAILEALVDLIAVLNDATVLE
jgi:hypothetical protein